MTGPVLAVSGLNKRFGGLPATQNVSLSVMAGERRLIIGPNGAGKTTLFNLITGDLEPDSGSVQLFGRELLKIPTKRRVAVGPGTLELLILKALGSGAKHGYGIVEHLRITSDDILQVGESALYPALQRLLLQGWVKAEWGVSDANRRAKYYTLTAAGRKQLAGERAEFERMVGAIRSVLEAT